MKVTVIFMVGIFYSSWLTAYESDIATFLRLYQVGRVDEAIAAVFTSNRHLLEQKQHIAELEQALSSLRVDSGRYYGNDHLDVHTIAEHHLLVTYRLRHQHQPVRLEFEYYRPQKQWQLQSLNFDADFSAQLKSAARYNIADYQMNFKGNGAEKPCKVPNQANN